MTLNSLPFLGHSSRFWDFPENRESVFRMDGQLGHLIEFVHNDGVSMVHLFWLFFSGGKP
jgi:hypothetical protein